MNYKVTLLTAETTNMEGMFKNCTNLETLNIKKWDVSKVTNMKYMFEGDTKLANVYVASDWNSKIKENVSGADMFKNCTSIVGAMELHTMRTIPIARMLE